MEKKKASLMIKGLLIGILVGYSGQSGWAEGNSGNEESLPAEIFDTFKVIPADGPSFIDFTFLAQRKKPAPLVHGSYSIPGLPEGYEAIDNFDEIAVESSISGSVGGCPALVSQQDYFLIRLDNRTEGDLLVEISSLNVLPYGSGSRYFFQIPRFSILNNQRQHCAMEKVARGGGNDDVGAFNGIGDVFSMTNRVTWDTRGCGEEVYLKVEGHAPPHDLKGNELPGTWRLINSITVIPPIPNPTVSLWDSTGQVVIQPIEMTDDTKMMDDGRGGERTIYGDFIYTAQVKPSQLAKGTYTAEFSFTNKEGNVSRFTHPLTIRDPVCRAVYPDSLHRNESQANRLNLVFVGGDQNVSDYLRYVRATIDLEGKQNGLFTKDPFNKPENRRRFNFWYLDKQVDFSDFSTRDWTLMSDWERMELNLTMFALDAECNLPNQYSYYEAKMNQGIHAGFGPGIALLYTGGKPITEHAVENIMGKISPWLATGRH